MAASRKKNSTVQHQVNAPPAGTTFVGGRPFAWGSRTFVMGVINTTPDSFSGDGTGADVAAAVRQGLRFQEEGADIVDVGGESTRPPYVYAGSQPVSAQEEMDRVIPVVQALKRVLDVPISIDTYKASVAGEALKAGAAMINDVWGFKRDPGMAALAARTGVPVVLMHNQEHTRYDGDVVTGVIRVLASLRDAALAAGVAKENIVLDPGMGFGKTAQHNLEILRRLPEFRTLGTPLLIGMSRKSTIGLVLDLPPSDRVEGTAATVALSIAGGADIVRVHDVKQMVRVARMSDAVVRGWNPPRKP
ncbi:MAG: dihydropteroate synthase [SAR202 cluster bacterium]|nr:dihydropteroate synthase [SAR202 cluster bacterium]